MCRSPRCICSCFVVWKEHISSKGEEEEEMGSVCPQTNLHQWMGFFPAWRNTILSFPAGGGLGLPCCTALFTVLRYDWPPQTCSQVLHKISENKSAGWNCALIPAVEQQQQSIQKSIYIDWFLYIYSFFLYFCFLIKRSIVTNHSNNCIIDNVIF